MSNNRVKRDSARSFVENLDETTLEYGYAFAAAFFALWKSLKMHGEKNESVQTNLDAMFDVMKKFFSTFPAISFGFNGIDIVINEQRLKSKRSGENYLDLLRQLFMAVHIGEIVIPSDINRSDLVLFCNITRQVTLGAMGDENTFKRINDELQRHGSKISASIYTPIEDEMPPVIDPPQMARQVYRNLINEFMDFQNKADNGQPLPVKKGIRIIQNLIDLLDDITETSQWNHLLTLASLNSYRGNYIPTHAANVTVLTLAVATTMKVPRQQLLTMGLAAYLHDIALDDFRLKDHEDKHCVQGFSCLSRLNSLNYSMMEAAVTAGAHHRKYDFVGTPVLSDERHIPTPYSEIVNVCDYYDIVTRWWPGRAGKPMSRPAALEKILSASQQKDFSFAAANALISTLGMYPHGTVCKVLKQPYYACVVGGFRSNYEPARVVLLNDSLEFAGTQDLYPAQLKPLPMEQHFRLPPSTLNAVFRDFQINSSPD